MVNLRHYQSKYPDLQKLIHRLHLFGYSVRLSCTLIKGYIDSVSQAKKMIASARLWQSEHLTLRLVAAPKSSENLAVKNWTQKHALSESQVNNLSKFFESEAHRLVTFDYGGAIYDYQGQNVCFTKYK